MKKFYALTISVVFVALFIVPGEVYTQPIKDSILKNYTQKDYEAFLFKERRGEIPDQSGPVPLSPSPFSLVNNNAGSTGTGYFTQSETSILAWGDNIVIGYNDAGSNIGGANKFTGFSYSTDGGTTFTDGGSLPTNPGGDAGDPVLARDDVSGRIYYSTLQFVDDGIPIYRSDDDGQTWQLPTQGAPGMSGFADKQWIAVDNYAGSGQGNVYMVVRDFGPRNGIYFYRSIDQGDTFGPNGGIEITSGFQGAFVAVGTDHSVYAFWWDGDEIKMRKSTDFGVSFAPAVVVVSGLTGPQTNGGLGLTGTRNGLGFASGFRSNSFPHAAVNPVSGHIYVTYNDNPDGTDKGDIYMVMSTDGGTTWSSEVLVNDDGTTTDQWQPTIAVTPDGTRLGIFYNSRQDDIDNNLFRFYGRTAGISGSTLIWNPSLAISDVNSLPEFGRDSRVNSSYMGDYNQAAATNSHFHIVWSDNRDDLAGGDPRKDPNVYYKSIPVDPFAGPNISVTPVNIDFGKVPVDAGAVSVEVSVYNPGDEQLIISGWSLNNPAFSTSLSVPEFIPPDGLFTLNVSFNPNALGTFDGIFTIASNALNSPNVQIQLTGVGTVDNDICAYATPIPEIGCDPVTLSGTTIDATVDSDAGNCGTSITAPGIWYTFLGTGTLMTASTCNAADFDTKISVYTGDCESLQCVVGSDDTPGCNAATTEVSWNSAVGEVYYILVHGFSDATGNFDLTISTDGLQPEIDVNPQQFEFVLEVGGTDSDDLTIGNFGDCPVDLSWFISENNPTAPIAPGYGKQSAGSYPAALPLTYSIGEKSIHALEKDGFFDEIPVQEQLQSFTGQQFRTEEALMEALTSVVNVSEVDEDILSYMQKYMVVQSGRVLLSDEEAIVQASDIADPDQGSLYTPIELDKNFQPSNPLAAQVIFDNGPLVNSPGTGFGGADESVVQNLSLGLTFFGWGHQVSANNKVLEDFTVSGASGWIVETLDFFAYQTGSTTASTITGVYYQIYDGFPDDPGTNVVFGDFITNRLLSSEWSNIYRVLETSSGNTERPIMKNTADAGFLLPPGDYWIAWQVDGSASFSGPWVPAVTINGQAVTGNAYQSINDAAYNPVLDNGNVQGLPFVINGEINDLCTWLTPDQFLGITPGQSSTDVTLSVDASGLSPGIYTCDLIISSNASTDPEILVPVTLEVVGCFAPENLTATSITANSAELGWTETGSATSWQVMVGVEGFDTTGVVPENTNSNPTNVSDLSSLTNYDFYVRSECPDGSYSDWTGPFTFTTLCAPPVAICKDYVFEFGTSSGQVVLNLTPADIDNGSFAACGLSSLAVSPNVLTFDCDNYNIPQEVTLTVIDVNGNSNSCTAQVYGTDETPPQAICQDLDVYLDQNGEFSISEDAVDGGSSDACGIASWDTDITAFSCDDLGEPVSVTLTVTDFAGNSAECQAEITVLDTVSPVVMFCPPDYLLPSDPGECGAVADYFPIASDNCGIASFITSPAPGSFLPVGTTTVTSTAVDLSGNTTICAFDVTVFDSEVPTIITPGNIVVNNDPGQCGAVIDYDLTITDNCGIANTFVSMPSGSFFPVGIHTVNIFVTDVNGQFRTASFEVTVYDREAPVIVCPGDIVVNTEPGTCEAVVEFSVSATDNCPGAIQIITDIPSGSVFEEGTTVVTATATDGPGNQSECTFNVIVQDNQPPVIEVADIITIWPPNSKYETFSTDDLVVSVSDNCQDISIDDVLISMATSDEPEDANGGGDGHTLNDMVIAEDCKSVKVRKERQGKGNGRVYSVHLELTDENGNLINAVCKIHVPKATGKPVIDDGVAYTVNGECGSKSISISQDNFITLQENELVAYPNPFSDLTTIVFTVSQNGKASVDIYNAVGSKVATVFDAFVESGVEYSTEFGSGDLPEGIYYYNLRIGNSVNMMKKLILIR